MTEYLDSELRIIKSSDIKITTTILIHHMQLYSSVLQVAGVGCQKDAEM